MANTQPIPTHPRFKDLTGLTFGRWEVLGYAGTKQGSRQQIGFWLCHCQCGTEREVPGSSLKQGASQSCGCLTAETTGNRRRTHGMSASAEYKIWQMMIDRCTNPNSGKFSYYGGRGIAVCERWRESFENFFADMGPRPSEQYSIERENGDGNYEPSNCHWATLGEQRSNQRNNHLITHNGKTMTLAAWSRETGLKRETISQRLRRGASIADALTKR